MAHKEVEDWLPLRGRWLGYFWQGLGVLSLFLLLWSLQWLMPVTLGTARKGPVGTAKAQINNFKTSLELYRIDHGGKPPTTRQGLRALLRPPRGKSDPRWKGPYLNDLTSVPLDPWRHPYVYASPGPKGEPYLVLSYGADGKAGGTGEGEDISNLKR